MTEINYHHGVVMLEEQELGRPVSPASTSIIGLVVRGTPYEYEQHKAGVVLLRTSADVTAFFPLKKSANDAPPPEGYDARGKSQARRYLDALFTESSGKTLVRVTADDPTGDDVKALEHAGSAFGLTANLFLAPGLGGMAADLSYVAMATDGLSILDYPDSGSATEDLKLLPNWLKTNNKDAVYCTYSCLDYGDGPVPSSLAVAGHIRRLDDAQGWWVSPSNKILIGAKTITTPVGFSLTASGTQANEFNESGVTVFIAQDGIRPWGNRLLGGDTFVNVFRVKKAVKQSIAKSMLWAIDNNITKGLVSSVLESVNNFLRDLRSQGAILGGSAFLPADQNTTANIREGKLFVDFELTPLYPSERLTFRMNITHDRLKEVLNV